MAQSAGVRVVRRPMGLVSASMVLFVLTTIGATAQDWWKPYSPPCTERENVFEFTEKPAVKLVGKDRYEITFAVKGYCDVTVAIVDPDPTKELVKGRGIVVRHLASGVLGPNAPPPFQKNSLKQTLIWNGKDDLDTYVKGPERMQVRVMLGLKPVFDKLLGTWDPKNIPGFVLGIAIDADGAYVWIRGQGSFGHVTIRKFDHDGKYVMTLTPPPSHLPESKLGGRSYIEWAPGVRSHHGPLMQEDIGYAGNVLPGVGGRGLVDFQPAIINGKMYFCNAGPGYRSGKEESMCYYIYTDGSTDVRGLTARLFMPGMMGHEYPRFAASPDGKWLYVTGVGSVSHSDANAPLVMRMAVDGDGLAERLIGEATFTRKGATSTPGSDNEHLNNPTGIDTDSSGRIYVCDNYNNRVQIFSPEGAWLKTIEAERPHLVCVHKKTGAIYLQHKGRVMGRTVNRLTKFASFDRPVEEFHIDGIQTAVMALDSWTPKPRIWVAGGLHRMSVTTTGSYQDRSGPSVTVWEEDGQTLRQIVDFDAEAEKAAGAQYIGRWEGSCYDKVVCDPTRETLWWCWEKNQASRVAFDLRSGAVLGEFWLRGAADDIAFCKRGYLHVHFNPGFYMPGVGRLDPDNKALYDGMSTKWRLPRSQVYTLKEVPYDYGIEKPPWRGVLPVKDQPGAKYFQDGFGVNMRSDVAEQCNIYYVPKMEEAGWLAADIGRSVRDMLGQGSGPSRYPDFLRSIQELEKRGEAVYYIRRRPGIPLSGGTIWTFDSTGELRDECAVIADKLVVGSFIDEDGFLYFANDGARVIDGKPFLYRRGGNFGADEPISKYNWTPVTYTFVKTRPRDVRWLLNKAVVRLEPRPERPVDLVPYGPFGPPYGPDAGMWVEGVEWMYAGYSPAVPAGCTCPSTRAHLDWFKRSYIPEAYRRSIGILDTNGNVILHVGRYGNYDDALRMRPGTDGIALTLPRFISGTDNYMCFDDWGERLVVLKLTYHAEESATVVRP